MCRFRERNETTVFTVTAAYVDDKLSIVKLLRPDCREDARVKKALDELAKHTMFVRILGSYPNVSG